MKPNRKGNDTLASPAPQRQSSTAAFLPKDLSDAEEMQKLGNQLFQGALAAPSESQGAFPSPGASLDHAIAQLLPPQTGKELSAVQVARAQASKQRKTAFTDAIHRAEREAELKRLEEESEAQVRAGLIGDHASIRDGMVDVQRRQRVEDTTKRALRQLQQLSDFLCLDRVDPQLAKVAGVTAAGPPLQLDKEIQRRMVPHQLRPSEMFHSNIQNLEHLIEAVAVIQAPTTQQLDEEEKMLLEEAEHDTAATKILLAQCTCAARLDHAIARAEQAAIIRTRVECTDLFAKMTVAAANMIRSLELLVYEKDQYIDDVTASNNMLVQKYDALLRDFELLEKDTSRKIREAEANDERLTKGSHQRSSSSHVNASAIAPSSPGSNQPTVGKHTVIIRQREFLEREARALRRYREMFEVKPEDNPCPAGSGGLTCNPPTSSVLSPVSTSKSFRGLNVSTMSAHTTNAGGGRERPQPKNFGELLVEEFRLDAIMKPEEKKTSARWVQEMIQRIKKFQSAEQNSRSLEKQLMAIHDVPEDTREYVGRGIQTMKEEDVPGSPAWEQKYVALREAAAKSLRPEIKRTVETREILQSEFSIKAEMRKCNFDANHGVPPNVAKQVESVLACTKEMMIMVDYARVEGVQKLTEMVKDEAAMIRGNQLQAQLEQDLDDGLFNLRRSMALLKASVAESLKPVLFSSAVEKGKDTSNTSSTARKARDPGSGGLLDVSDLEEQQLRQQDMLESITNRFSVWASKHLGKNMPSLLTVPQFQSKLPVEEVMSEVTAGGEAALHIGGDQVAAEEPKSLMCIKDIDVILDVVAEALEPPADEPLPGGAGGRRRGGPATLGGRQQSHEGSDDDTKQMMQGSVSLALVEVVDLIQTLRSTIPTLSLSRSVVEGIGISIPSQFTSWNDLCGQLRRAVDWVKETSSAVELHRIEAAALKKQQQREKEEADAAAKAALAAAMAAAVPSEQQSPVMTVQPSPKKGLAAKMGRGRGGRTQHHPQASTAAAVEEEDIAPPPPPPPPPEVPPEGPSPLAENIHLLATSIRDVMYRLTSAISKTTFNAARIPVTTMREAMLLEKQFAEEDATTWTTEQLAVLIARVTDWADVVGDIIALPYEMSGKAIDENPVRPLESLPSVYTIRNQKKAETAGCEAPFKEGASSAPKLEESPAEATKASKALENAAARLTPASTPVQVALPPQHGKGSLAPTLHEKVLTPVEREVVLTTTAEGSSKSVPGIAHVLDAVGKQHFTVATSNHVAAPLGTMTVGVLAPIAATDDVMLSQVSSAPHIDKTRPIADTEISDTTIDGAKSSLALHSNVEPCDATAPPATSTPLPQVPAPFSDCDPPRECGTKSKSNTPTPAATTTIAAAAAASGNDCFGSFLVDRDAAEPNIEFNHKQSSEGNPQTPTPDESMIAVSSILGEIPSAVFHNQIDSAPRTASSNVTTERGGPAAIVAVQQSEECRPATGKNTVPREVAVVEDSEMPEAIPELIAEEVEKEAQRIQDALRELYPELVDELKEAKVKDHVTRQRAVVVNRKQAAQTVDAMQQLCADIVDTMELTETLPETILANLASGNGNFSKVVHHVRRAVNMRKDSTKLLSNDEIENLAVEKEGLLEEIESLRQTSTNDKVALQALEEALRELVAEKEELVKQLEEAEAQASALPMPVMGTTDGFIDDHRLRSGDTAEGGLNGEMVADAMNTGTAQTGEVAPRPAHVYGDTALEELSLIRRQARYRKEQEKFTPLGSPDDAVAGATISQMVITCMRRLVGELSESEKSALIHELVGDVSVTLHVALMSLFALQLFKRLRLHTIGELRDPLIKFREQEADAKRAAELTAAATKRRVKQPPVIPSIYELLKFDQALLDNTHTLLRDDSDNAWNKMKKMFARVKTRVNLRKTQQLLEKRKQNLRDPNGLKREMSGFFLQRDREYLERRERQLQEDLAKLQEQREAIAAEQARRWQNFSLQEARCFHAGGQGQPLPMNKVLIFVTETDAEDGRAAGQTDASMQYMESFKHQITQWFQHAQRSSTQLAQHNALLNATLSKPMTCRPCAKDGGDVLVDDDDYIKRLIPVKAVNMVVDREMARRRQAAAAVGASPSAAVKGPSPSVHSFHHHQLQTMRQQRVEELLSATLPSPLTASPSQLAFYPRPELHVAAATRNTSLPPLVCAPSQTAKTPEPRNASQTNKTSRLPLTPPPLGLALNGSISSDQVVEIPVAVSASFKSGDPPPTRVVHKKPQLHP